MRFFLSSFVSLVFITFIVVFWLLGLFWLSLGLFLCYGLILFFSRRLSPAFQEDGLLKRGLFYAPVNGRIVARNEDYEHPDYAHNVTELVIVTSWWQEHGIYFPIKSEVNELSYVGNKGHFRYWYKNHLARGKERKPSLVLRMNCSDSSSYGIEFYKCTLGFWPKLIIIPGDRGRAQVNMGFFGMGGTTLIYLPKTYETTVTTGMNVIAGQTILARTTEQVKVE